MWLRRLAISAISALLAYPLTVLAQTTTATINGVPNQAVSAATCLGANSTGVIHGISYTNCYTGSTFDVRVNAAFADADNLANGNTTGIVDSTQEPQSLTQTGQITAGDGTHIVLWKLGAGTFVNATLTPTTGVVSTSGTAVTWVSGSQFSTSPSWAGQPIVINSVLYTIAGITSATSLTLTATAGTQTSVAYTYTPSAVVHNPDTSIVCEGSIANKQCTFTSFSAYQNIYTVYTTNGSGYYRLDGVYFANKGSTFGSNHLAIINGGYDGSTWINDQFQDWPSSNPNNGAVVTINNVCCHSNFTNDMFDSEWGSTAVDLENAGHGINFQDDSFNAHGSSASGNPNILCHDSGPGTNSGISFTGVTYMEGQSAVMTAPWIQDNGCQALQFSGTLNAGERSGTGTTSPIIDVSSAFETTLNIGNTLAVNAGGTWTYPVTIVKQHNTTSDCGSPPCNVAVTDAAGSSPGYLSRTTQFNTVNAGALQSKVYTVSTLPSASSLTAGTQVTVSDSTNFTPGTCTGGGSDYMIAITNGSLWSCH